MSDIIEAIDNALADYSVSADAMRWTADPEAIGEASQALAARRADYLAFAIDQIERQYPPAVPDPTYAPKPATIGDYSYLRHQRGWTTADSGPLRWIRMCELCGQPRHVIEGVKTRPLGVWMVEPTVVEPEPLELCQKCAECRTPFNGPMMLAQHMFDKTTYAHNLRLSACGGSIIMRVHDQAVSYPGYVETAWLELERMMLDAVTYRDPCAISGCDQRARHGWDVHRPVSLDGSTLGRGKAVLCPRHNFELESNLMRDGHMPMFRAV